METIKKAVKREPGAPIGVPARCYIECCGRRIWLDEDWSAIFGGDEYVRCTICWQTYTKTGWVVPPPVVS